MKQEKTSKASVEGGFLELLAGPWRYHHILSRLRTEHCVKAHVLHAGLESQAPLIKVICPESVLPTLHWQPSAEVVPLAEVLLSGHARHVLLLKASL